MENRESFEILKSADVIAMTTTGAAKYRDLIYNLPVSVKPYDEIYFCAYFEFFWCNLNLPHHFVVFVHIYPLVTGQHKTLTMDDPRTFYCNDHYVAYCNDHHLLMASF